MPPHIDNLKSLGLVQASITSFFAAFMPTAAVEVTLRDQAIGQDIYPVKIEVLFEHEGRFEKTLELDAALSTFPSTGVKFLTQMSDLVDDFLLARSHHLNVTAPAYQAERDKSEAAHKQRMAEITARTN